MANRIRIGDLRGFNKGHSSKFRVGFRVRQTPEEGGSTYRPEHCGNNNEDKDNSPKTHNDKNHQASSQKFRQLIKLCLKKKKKKKKDFVSSGGVDKYIYFLHCIKLETKIVKLTSA